MSELVVIVPTRGRPEAARELAAAFAETCTADTRLIFAVDDDDPLLPEYKRALDEASVVGEEDGWAIRRPTGAMLAAANRSMVEALNTAAVRCDSFAVGFLGDDHRPRTVGWDARYLEALRELGTGIVYGNDLLQSERLPTQCAMTADIVRALGFMAPPMLRHMYVDNFWRDLGSRAGCLRYLPEVVVEHLHPVAGKADWDEGYRRVNATEVYSADGAAYQRYVNSEMAAAIAKVRQLRQTTQLVTGVHEWRLFEEGTVPEYTRPEWYAGREHAPHLEQAGHRARLLNTATFVAQAAFTLGARTVVDLGAGDGGLLSLLGPGLRSWGYDLMPSNIEAAKGRGVDVRYGDVIEGDIEWGEVAVCTEVLEHLVDPAAFVRRIAEHSRALVCSSPHDERPGAAYQYHTFAWDFDGYRALVEQAGFKVIRQRPVNRFQVILAVKP